jgi:hypothetical protein
LILGRPLEAVLIHLKLGIEFIVLIDLIHLIEIRPALKASLRIIKFNACPLEWGGGS